MYARLMPEDVCTHAIYPSQLVQVLKSLLCLFINEAAVRDYVSFSKPGGGHHLYIPDAAWGIEKFNRTLIGIAGRLVVTIFRQSKQNSYSFIFETVKRTQRSETVLSIQTSRYQLTSGY